MRTQTHSAAKKFWIVFPTVMRTIFAESRKGDLNLAPNHFRVLGAIAARNCNLSELAEHQSVSLPTMSATVETLVERGWLERDRSEVDRREVTLRMTEEGSRVLTAEHRRLTEWVAAKMEALDPKDVKRVERALDILLALFEKSHVEQAEVSATKHANMK
jgi:DNA-binding MarR family transcriptional regulator